MSILKRLWIGIVRYIEALEGIDDPVGDYMLSLGNRIDKLEYDLDRLERQLFHAAIVGSSNSPA